MIREVNVVRKSLKVLILGLAMALIGLAVGPVWGAYVSLTIKNQVVVDGPRVTLDDLIASISGGSPQVRDRILRQSVGDSPQPGESKTITADEINRLLAYGKTGLERVQATIPPRIKVTRSSQILSRDRLAEFFERTVRDNLPWQPDRVAIDNLDLPEDMRLAGGEIKLETQPPLPSQLPGRIRLKINVLVNGRQEARVKVSGQVRFFQRVVVAARRINSGRLISAADVRLEEKSLRRNPGRLLSRLEAAVGRQTTTSLRAGQPISGRALSSPSLVKKGDKVTLIASKDGLIITCPGIIKDQAAGKGDQVKVMNLTTKRVVIGRLVGPDTVRVYF